MHGPPPRETLEHLAEQSKKVSAMVLEVGARVVVGRQSTEHAGRSGTIQEVLHGDPSPRYRIAWDDGHETIYTPAAGALHAVEPHDTGSPR